MRGRTLIGIALVGIVGIATAVIVKSRGRHEIESGALIVYSMDLDAVVDDRASDIAHDLESRFAEQRIVAKVSRPMVPVGAVTVTVDAAKRSEVDQLIRSEYRESVESRPCEAGAPQDALCFVVVRRAIEEAALDSAVDTIRRRLDNGESAAAVYKKGDRIVVEVPGSTEELFELRSLIVRTGKLEFKVVDDGSRPGEGGRGAPFMQKVFSHVGMMSKRVALDAGLKEGDPIDPIAKQLGVSVGQDYWRVEDGGATHSDFYLKAFDQSGVELPIAEAKRLGCSGRAAPGADTMTCRLTGRQVIDRYLAQLAVTDPSFKVPDDHQIAYELVEPMDTDVDRRPIWRSYYLFREARVTGRSIADATGTFDANTNRPIVTLEFNREGARVFGDLTASIVGQKLATVLDGKVKSAPIINGAIRGGHAWITMGGNEPDRQLKERDELVGVLKAGSLPAPLREESFEEIGPR